MESFGHSKIATEKALELIENEAGTIHLVALIPTRKWWKRYIYPKAFSRLQNLTSRRNQQIDQHLEQLRESILEKHPNIVVKTATINEHIMSDDLIRYAREHRVDLAIVGNKRIENRFRLFHKDKMNELVNHTDIALLSVGKNSLNKPIKSILLPVTSFVPERRIQMTLAFAQQFNAHIHLVTLLDKTDTTSKIKVDAFYLTYKILVEHGYSPQYKILQGTDSTAAFIRYADQIKADILLLTTTHKRPAFRFIQKRSTDMLSPLSALQILTLKPYK